MVRRMLLQGRLYFVVVIVMTLLLAGCAPSEGILGTEPAPGLDDGASGVETVSPGMEGEPTVEAGLPETGLSPSVMVDDQAIEGGLVTISEVISEGPGWIVIHADEMGAPGPVIGFAPVLDGSNQNVTVEVDSAQATETVHAMLHIDAGTEGEYEFPGADVPAEVNGEVVMQPFVVTGGMENGEGEGMEGGIVEVGMGSSFFDPAELSVVPGTTVVWTNTNTLPHTVTADDGLFDSGTMSENDAFEFTFDTPGQYPYYCEFHGAPGGVGMAGVITVEE